MNIELLKERVMKQAEEKGFGTKLEDIVVSEKIALIHSEITEAYNAYSSNNLEKKDGFYEELGDALQRTLHLGGAYGVTFQESSDFELDAIASSRFDGKIARLHKITSEAWENYRHKRLDQFKYELCHLAYAIIQVSLDYGFSLEEAVIKKLESNKGRTWNKTGMNERFS